MREKLKYLIKNISIFTVGELGSKLINFILVPLYTYILSTEEYGTVDLLFTIAMVLIPLVMFNIGEAVMRYAMDENADHSKLLSISACAMCCGVAVSLLIVPLAAQFRVVAAYKWHLYFYVVASAMKSIITCYLRGCERLVVYVSCNLLNTFLIAILNIIFLVRFHMGIAGFLSAYIIADLLAVICAAIVGGVFKDAEQFSFDWRLAKKMLLFSIAVVPNSLLWWGINSSDRIIVTWMCGVSETGLLAVSYKIPSILVLTNTILMQAWKYSAIKEKNSIDRDAFTNVMLNVYFKLSVINSAVLILAIRGLVKFLFADTYFVSWRSSVFLLLGFVFMGIGTFVGTTYYVEKDMTGNMLSALAGAVANIILDYCLIPFMGAAGATMAACISYFVIMVYRLSDTRKYINIDISGKGYGCNIILLILLAVGSVADSTMGVLFAWIMFALIAAKNYRFISKMILKGIQTVRMIYKSVGR